MRVFKLSNLQHNGEQIGDPCRQRHTREDREDSDEERLFCIEFLKELYPLKYAKEEQRSLERAAGKTVRTDIAIAEAQTAVLCSLPPLLTDDMVNDDLVVDPALLTQ